MTVEYLTSRVLRTHRGLRHAFFTRNGGVSEPPYASLNCAFGSADDARAVRENRARVARAVNVAPAAICAPRQTHSATVLTLTGAFDSQVPQADATVTDVPGLALAVMGADCAPVLFSSPRTGIVGASHAGWKGALDGVLEATVEALCALGAEPGAVDAAIGPCIHAPSYEVGPEFEQRFVQASPRYAAFFSHERGGRRTFDLPGFVEHRLLAAGLRQVERIDADTCADEQRFFSYRRCRLRNEPGYGRQISVVVLERSGR